MTEVDNKNPRLWYVKRKKNVRGPFPYKQIKRYIGLGRIVDSDELSVDNKNWSILADLPELKESVPDDDISVKREDEREFGDRRDKQKDVPVEIMNRRAGDERRTDEKEEDRRHRAMKTQFLAELRDKKESYVVRFVIIVISLGLITAVSIFLNPKSKSVDVNIEKPCEVKAMPGVNWDNCRLDGLSIEDANLEGASIKNARLRSAKLHGANLNRANLSYCDLATADISNSQMAGVSLKGANLQGADLSYTDLKRADLSYADFTNANLGGSDFSGAVLDHAVWIDGKVCAPGSVGQCN